MANNTCRATEAVVIKLINAEKNKELLESIPHRYVMDLAVVYCEFFVNSEGRIELTPPINNGSMLAYGIGEVGLFHAACRNMKNMFRAELRNFMGMTVVTNSISYFGASAILYSDIVKQYADENRTDVYLLPSSQHELILMKKGELGLERMKAMVKAVNATDVITEEDYLSDNIYLYDRSTGKLDVA